MKRICTLLLTISLAGALLAGCSWLRPPREESVPEESRVEPEPLPEPEPDVATPDGAVAELFQSAKAWDVEKINGYLPAGVDVQTYVPVELQGTIQEVLNRLEYTVGKTETDGDTATVEVTVTAIDAESAVDGAISAAAVQALKSKLAGKELSYTELAKVAIDSVDIPSLPTKTTTAQAHMVRSGDEWKLDTGNQANMPLLNAASGGVVELYGSVKDLAEEYGISLSQ